MHNFEDLSTSVDQLSTALITSVHKDVDNSVHKPMNNLWIKSEEIYKQFIHRVIHKLLTIKILFIHLNLLE